MVGFLNFNSTMGKKEKKERKKEKKTNTLFISPNVLHIFTPICLLFTLFTWHVRKERLFISVFREAYNIRRNFFYNNLNKYLAFTLMCLFVLSDWECFILIRSKYSRYNAFREWYDFNI